MFANFMFQTLNLIMLAHEKNDDVDIGLSCV
jgi:hypothetical protein